MAHYRKKEYFFISVDEFENGNKKKKRYILIKCQVMIYYPVVKGDYSQLYLL